MKNVLVMKYKTGLKYKRSHKSKQNVSHDICSSPSPQLSMHSTSAADKWKQQGNVSAPLWNKLSQEKEKTAVYHMMLTGSKMALILTLKFMLRCEICMIILYL